MKLQDYNFILKHILGKTNTKVDILSWKDQIDTKEDNKVVQLLKDEIWTRKMTAKVTILERMMTEESNIIKRIQRNNTREKEIVQVLEKNNRSTWKEERVVYMEGRIYMLNNKEIREEILKEHYDPADIGHPGQLRMMKILKRTYWWPGLKEDVKKYIQGCFKCQQNKVQHQKKAGELHPLEIPQGLWQEISIDIIGPLPKSNGMDAIVVIVDRFTKMIHLKATTTNVSLEGIAKIYSNDIWKLHRIPRKILSNRGLQFALSERIHKSTGDKETTIDGIPSTNRWSNGKNQSRDRNVSATLRELPTG